ncbi:MAG TPA: type I-E CRISPR-associated protein Cse1/CasA [Tepidisphaeraceae bacterium]|nr:type I-E CRISPR-associated protein Cse1/CasA [Tepidisphaeraceae bacterium]
MADSFNLVDEPWIPVLYSDGRFERVGIKAALTEAGKIRQIAASNPMDHVALLRFLLAVRSWCGNDVSKLGKHRDSFNLLGDGTRFYQEKDGPANDRPIGDLLIEFPTETKIAHFRHVRDRQYGLCPACCALGIIRFCGWANAYGGGRYHTAVNGPAPAYALPLGVSLAETFDLNRISVAAGDPPWLNDSAPDANQLDAVKVFAWRSRRLWLGDLGTHDETCSYCGQSARLIRQLAFTGNWEPPFQTRGRQKKFWDQDPHLILEERSTQDDGDQGNETACDQSTAPEPNGGHAVKSKKKDKPKVLTTLGFPVPSASVTAHARFWRRALLAIITRQSADHTKPCIVAGPAANKGLYQDAASVHLPAVFDGKKIKSAAEAVAQSTEQLLNVLRRSTSNPDRQHPDRKAALDGMTPELEQALRDDVVNGSGAPTVLAMRLQPVVEAVVRCSTAGSPLRRREAIQRAQRQLDAVLQRLSQKPEGGK